MEDQIGALGLVLNALVLSNTRCGLRGSSPKIHERSRTLFLSGACQWSSPD
jgi:hypothetical protein